MIKKIDKVFKIQVELFRNDHSEAWHEGYKHGIKLLFK